MENTKIEYKKAKITVLVFIFIASILEIILST